MSASNMFLSGVIEGFYGRSWSPEIRLAYANYLADAGLNTYLYAPKSDPILRRQWQESWPESELQELQALSRACRAAGVYWGVGLSPMELYRNYGATQREQLRRKVDYLGELQAPLLAVLFDDMPGDIDALASRQSEIVADICDWVGSVHVLVCPTYYSHDSVLEQHFGGKPQDYWPQLGRELPTAVDIFWTGNKVCSEVIALADIETINSQLGRPVTLWDNYPVNDGAQRSNFIYTKPLHDRSPDLRPVLRGHLCNPMNQGLLSLPALGGLAALYGHGGFGEDKLGQLLGRDTWAMLRRDAAMFAGQGLAGMGEQRCRQLALEYGSVPGEAANEIAQWLRGEYQFDPACLTD